MAIKEVLKTKQFLGLSTDTKPTENVWCGSTFYELNTGLRWIYDGTNWVEDLSLIYALSQVQS